MNKRSIKMSERCSTQIKEMWQDSDGFWAAAAPGWCFDTLSGYLLYAETEDELMSEAGERVHPEEYEVRDLVGQQVSVVSYERACELLPRLRLGYSIISTSTGENFERIQPSVHHRHQDFLTLEQEDGTKIYSLPDYSLTVREEVQKDGTIHLTPLTGAVACTSRSWQELPEEGLNAACLSLEQQINRETGKDEEETQPLLRVTGDRSDPLVSALLALPPQKGAGLIEVAPMAGGTLSIQAIPQRQPSDLKAINRISQMLQDNGYEEASKFLDCVYEL
ncbi:hypothetical protein [Flintibacter sp.]|uniref:hypothetical protein n=1 Tax=Flintibacter sp. TaxID=1918624 RepID=UPI003A28B7A1